MQTSLFLRVASTTAFVLGLSLLSISVARAQIGFTFSNPYQSTTAGGSTLYFDATLTNGSQASTLDGYDFSIEGLTVDSAPFEDYLNNNAPTTYSADYSYNLTAFAVDVPLSTASGTYTGFANLFYTTNGVSNQVSQQFSVTVNTVSALAFSLNPNTQLLTPGGSAVTFAGSLVNGNYDTTIDGFSFAMDSVVNGLTIDTAPFEQLLNTTGGMLQAGSSLTTQNFFTASATEAIDPGVYTGTATIDYTSNGTSSVVTQGFSIHVASVAAPEASTGTLLIGPLLLASMFLIVRRKKQAS